MGFQQLLTQLAFRLNIHIDGQDWEKRVIDEVAKRFYNPGKGADSQVRLMEQSAAAAKSALGDAHGRIPKWLIEAERCKYL